MKPKDWNESLNHMDPDLLEEYIEIRDKKKPKRPFWIATMAATLALTMGIGMLADNGILPTDPPNWETIPATEFTTDPTAEPTSPPDLPPPTQAPTNPVVTNPPTQMPTNPVVTNPPPQVPTNPVVTNPPTQVPSRPAVTNPPTQTPTQPRPVATNPPTQTPTQPRPIVTNPPTQTPTQPRPIVTNPPTTPPQEPVIVPLSNVIYEPVYPEMPQYPDPQKINPDSLGFFSAVRQWETDRKLYYQQPEGYADSLTDFFHESIQQFLQGEGNQVYSPLNVYLAMAMLAETTDGNSRQQILDLFGLDTIEQLREQVNHLWNAHYCEDGKTSTLLANSLWLDEGYTFKKETAQLLADRYYAASFSGDLGTEAMNKQLQSWLNENTGGLLTEQANNTELSDDSVFALASAVYFKSGWTSEFRKNETKDGWFHGVDADKKVPFMNKTMRGVYYWADNFGAVRLWLTGGNCMWLILPDEGYATTDILASDEYLQMTLDPEAWENKRELRIHLRLPKFDIAQQQDLIDGMKTMGVTDVFDYRRSDFSSLTDTPDLYVDMIDHAVRVKIDEEGCEGAAYTVIGVAMGTAPPPEVDEIDFVLDRPFMFVVSSQDNLPLFAGVVNEP